MKRERLKNHASHRPARVAKKEDIRRSPTELPACKALLDRIDRIDRIGIKVIAKKLIGHS